MKPEPEEYVMELEEYEALIQRLARVEARLEWRVEHELPIPPYAPEHLEGVRRMRAHLDWLLARLKGR